MQHIIDPDRLVPIVLDADVKDEKPIVFWVKMIGPIEHSRMQGIANLRAETAVAAGAKRNDPEVWERVQESEVGYLATRTWQIDNWPGVGAVTGTDAIERCLRCLTAASYKELYGKATGADALNDVEGKVSGSPS